MGEFDDLIPEYIAESTDLLESVENGLLALESGEREDEVIHTVFRAIHSIKGGAGFVGLIKVEGLAHKMEDLLNLIRNGDLEPTQPVTDSLLQSYDVLVSLFEHVQDSGHIDIEGPIRALTAALDSEADEQLQGEVKSIPAPSPEAGLPCFDISEYSLKNCLKTGNVYYIKLNLSAIEARGLTPIQLMGELLSMGELLDSQVILPDLEDMSIDADVEVAFDILYFTVLEGDLLSAALHLKDSDFKQLSEDDFEVECIEPNIAPPPPAPPAPEAAAPATPAVTPAPVPAETAPAPARPAPPPAAIELPAQAVEEFITDSEYLTFTLGGEHYGVDVLSVQEIIGVPHLSRLPRTPEFMLGVMNLRGNVVPVMDLRLKLGLEAGEDIDPVVVVFHVGRQVKGAVVDGVSDVIELDENDIRPAPEFAGAVRGEYIQGLTPQDDELIILLDMAQLLAPED